MTDAPQTAHIHAARNNRNQPILPTKPQEDQ